MVCRGGIDIGGPRKNCGKLRKIAENSGKIAEIDINFVGLIKNSGQPGTTVHGAGSQNLQVQKRGFQDFSTKTKFFESQR